MHNRRWRALKWTGLLLAVSTIAIAVVMMQSAATKPPTEETNAGAKPNTEVESPVIIERKDGKITWQLRAKEATQQLNGKMRMKRPTLRLYTQGGKEIKIQSRQAWFEPIARNVRFSKEVKVFFEQWRLESDLMIYNSSKDEITIPGAFTANGGTIHARGSNVTVERESEVITVADGIWIEDTNSQWHGATR